MRQLVLVDDFTTTAAALVAWLSQADLPDTPVVAVEAGDFAGRQPAAESASLVETLTDLPCEIFALPGRQGLVAVAAHHQGYFPERIGEQTRTRLAACDTLVARCPGRDAVSAAQFYSTLLYALDGQLTAAGLRSATAHLLGLVDRARNEAARVRQDRLDGDAPERSYAPTGDALRLSNLPGDEGPIEGTIFETVYGEISTEMARLGFEVASRKVRETKAALTVLVGAPGIAVYGPYVALEEGDYRYRLEFDCGQRDVAFTLEAAWNAGGQILAVHRYATEGGAARAFADLCFTVSGPAVGRALELRLWNDEASTLFDVVRLSLVRLARPW